MKSAPLHIVGCSAFALHEGRVLVLQRAPTEHFLPGYWELPGGKLEHQEHPYEGVAREVLEETGLGVTPLRPFATFHDTLPDGRHYVDLCLQCELASPQRSVSLSADHQAYRWITRTEVETLQPMSDPVRACIQEGFAMAEERA